MTPPNAVNASGINDKGNIVGQFTSGANTPGFILPSSTSNSFTTINQPTGITSDVINAQGINHNGPGATFVFSQILGIDDAGLAAGYFGNSITCQRGFFFNTNTGSYTFLDDPAAMFHNGVEITQVTGISNSGEIAGFDTDANGTFHSFVAIPTPKPGSRLFLVSGLLGIGIFRAVAQRRLTAAERTARSGFDLAPGASRIL